MIGELLSVAAKTAEVAVETIGETAVNAMKGADKLSVGLDCNAVMDALGIEPGSVLGEAGEAVAPEKTVEIRDSTGEVRHAVGEVEGRHYEECGLRPERVGERECLVRDDIDWGTTDVYGRTNLERAERGLAPLDENGVSYELHHVEQKDDGMLAELKVEEHRGKRIDSVLHDKTKTSEIDRPAFDTVRREHWKARAAQVRANGGA